MRCAESMKNNIKERSKNLDRVEGIYVDRSAGEMYLIYIYITLKNNVLAAALKLHDYRIGVQNPWISAAQ